MAASVSLTNKLQKTYFKNFFVVPYEIIGERCNGTWLVKTENKAAAKKLVKSQYNDYICRSPVIPYCEYCDEMGESPFAELYDITGQLPDEVEMGFAYLLECGT